MMKRMIFVIVALVLITVFLVAGADSARYLNKDKNQQYHSEHLEEHQGSKNCKVSTGHVEVWDDPTSKKVLGHLEQTDTFTIDELDGNLVKITVTRAAKTSKDSHDCLIGWVDAD